MNKIKLEYTINGEKHKIETNFDYDVNINDVWKSFKDVIEKEFNKLKE